MAGRFTITDCVSDWQRAIEAIYARDRTGESWIRHVVRQVAPLVDRGLGVCASAYDASRPGRFRLGSSSAAGMAVPLDFVLGLSRRFAAVPGFVERTFLSLPCATLSRVDDAGIAWRERSRRYGIGDVLLLNGCDEAGRGLYVRAFLPRSTTLRPAEERTLRSVAAHLREALQQRRRSSARELPGAIAELVRRGARATYPGHALDVRLPVLKPRERDVAALLARGCSTKQVAYALGIADSTVRVLIARICDRLAVRTRAELVARCKAAEAPR